MKHVHVLASPLALLLVPLTATAQSVAPGLSAAFARSVAFDTTVAPFLGCGANIQQVAFLQLPCNPAGEFTVTLSVGSLCATYNGNGSAIGLVEGTFNQTTGVVTLNTNANAIQTPGNQHFNLQLEPLAGRYCVYDNFNAGWVYQGVNFASRGSCGVPFGAAVPVTNLQGVTLGYADPSLGYIGGVLHLFYAGVVGGTPGIYRDALDLTNLNAPRVLGTPTLVRASTRGGQPNSPTPITGPDGDVEGLWHADLLGGANDMLFAPSLDPTVASTITYQNANWKNNGGIAGGRLMCGDGTFNWVQVAEAHGAWLLGDDELPGGTADIFGGAFFAPGNVALTVVFLSSSLSGPITVPGINGSLALNVALMPILGVMTHDVAQMGSMSLPIPNDPTLHGARLPIQGLSIELPTNVLTFTNNAWLQIR